MLARVWAERYNDKRREQCLIELARTNGGAKPTKHSVNRWLRKDTASMGLRDRNGDKEKIGWRR